MMAGWKFQENKPITKDYHTSQYSVFICLHETSYLSTLLDTRLCPSQLSIKHVHNTPCNDAILLLKSHCDEFPKSTVYIYSSFFTYQYNFVSLLWGVFWSQISMTRYLLGDCLSIVHKEAFQWILCSFCLLVDLL